MDTSISQPARRALIRNVGGCLAMLVLGGSPLALRAQPDAAAEGPGAGAPGELRWDRIRASLFGDRPIAVADDLLKLEVPNRAEDAAIVPIAVRTLQHDPTSASASRIHKLWLVIDQNPSPVAGIFEFGPRSARADLETRVRIDAYSPVRAIAETADGRLHMATGFVKASGGCSAPPGKDAAAAQANLGRMRLRVEGEASAQQPLLTQLMVSHPNDSGMVMDQLTRHYTPAHFVRQIEVSYGGERVLSADLDFAISENPNLRFWLQPSATDAELRVEVIDSRDLHFETAIALKAAPG